MSRYIGVYGYSESIKFQLSGIYVLSPNAIILPILHVYLPESLFREFLFLLRC